MTVVHGALRSVVGFGRTDAITAELARRRAALLATLEGSVLELSGPPASLRDLHPDPSVPSHGRLHDHIVTFGWLAAVDDIDAAAASLRELLAPQGWLHTVEPTRAAGKLARAQRLASVSAEQRTGWHLGRDIPAALRNSGFVITDLDRFAMPDSAAVLAPWFAGRARHRPSEVQL